MYKYSDKQIAHQWQEEVQLHNGDMMWVKRSADFTYHPTGPNAIGNGGDYEDSDGDHRSSSR